MEVPDLTAQGGTYLLDWPNAQVRIKVNRLRSSNGNISGEIVVQSTAPASPGHLHQARLNLTSTQSRQVLARTLTTRWNTVEWDSIIEQACSIVLSTFRQGPPVVDLSKLGAAPNPEPRLAPFLLEHQPTLIFGEGSSGKSLLAAYMAILISAGHSDQKTQMSAKLGSVLYLDFETDEWEIRQRIDAIRQGMGIEQMPPVLYLRGTQPVADQVEDLQEIIARHAIDFLVVDSVGYALGGEPENAGCVLEFFRALRSLEVTSLLLDHVAKAQDSKPRSRTPFGSVFKTNAARSVWELRKSQEAGSNVLSVGLFHRKVNNGQLLRPVGLRVEFVEGLITLNREDLREVPDLAEGLTITEQIKAILSRGSATLDDLAEEIGQSQRESISRKLRQYSGKHFVKLPNGAWGLMAHEGVEVQV